MININQILANKKINIANVIAGYEAILLTKITGAQPILFIAKDGVRAQNTKILLEYFAPHLKVASLPSYDTVPYDRISPNADVLSERIKVLSALSANPKAFDVVITTVNALMQKVPPPKFFLNSCRKIKKGLSLIHI